VGKETARDLLQGKETERTAAVEDKTELVVER